MLATWLRRALDSGLKPNSIVILLVLSFVAMALEVFGVGMFLPIFQFIKLDGDLGALSADSLLWSYIVNIFSLIGISPSLSWLLLVAFFLFLFRQVVTYIKIVYQSSTYHYIVQKQRNRMFKGYINAHSTYHDDVPVGNLVNVMTTEVNSAVTGVMAPIVLLTNVILLLGYVVFLLLLSPTMTVIVLLILLVSTRVPNVWIKKSYSIGKKFVNANIAMSEFLVGRLRSPRLVRLSGTESAEIDEFEKLTMSQREYILYNSILSAKTEVSIEPFIIGISLFFIYFSTTFLMLQIEAIGLYIVILLRLMPSVKAILLRLQSIKKLMGSMEAIESRIDSLKLSSEVDTGKVQIKRINDSIIFKKASYRYPSSDEYALKNISISIGVHKIVAIVGPSGSGKSTLIDLLPRIRTQTCGAIEIDGIDIEHYTLSSLRGLIAYVPQYPQIFNGTVKNHILYGKLGATDEEIQRAARLAGANKFIDKLPNGYNTIIGEDAVKLSGGQRQKLDLARALVSRAPLLILDEPTSNLDVESEELFIQVLKNIKKETNTTIIIVTHSLTSISDVDQIIVLNDGKIETSGIHKELLNDNSWYAKTWKK